MRLSSNAELPVLSVKYEFSGNVFRDIDTNDIDYF